MVTSSRAYDRKLADCHWSGRTLGSVIQRLTCAGSSLNKGDYGAAQNYLFQTKLQLKDGAWAIGKTTAKRLSKLLDDPIKALMKAQEQQLQGKQGRVGRGRLRPAEKAVLRAMNRASKKCS